MQDLSQQEKLTSPSQSIIMTRKGKNLELWLQVWFMNETGRKREEKINSEIWSVVVKCDLSLFATVACILSLL